MKTYQILLAATFISLSQGCSYTDFPFLSGHSDNYSDSYHDTTFDDDYMTDSDKPKTYEKDSEDEVPVQMTTKDTQLNSLKPESSAPEHKRNKNVVLPISEGLE